MALYISSIQSLWISRSLSSLPIRSMLPIKGMPQPFGLRQNKAKHRQTPSLQMLPNILSSWISAPKSGGKNGKWRHKPGKKIPNPFRKRGSHYFLKKVSIDKEKQLVRRSYFPLRLWVRVEDRLVVLSSYRRNNDFTMDSSHYDWICYCLSFSNTICYPKKSSKIGLWELARLKNKWTKSFPFSMKQMELELFKTNYGKEDSILKTIQTGESSFLIPIL